MSESGPLNRPVKTFVSLGEMSDLTPLGNNIFRITVDGKFFALKTAAPALGGLLRREYELSCNLSHPCIAGTLAFLEDSPVGAAILMEYVEGQTLSAFLSSGARVPSATRWKLLSQILDAVDYLHRKGLLHNDIKPDNIMVSAIGQNAKIIDFGLAQNDSDHLNRRLGGTPGASAPEVLEGDASAPSSASSDIYSLGGITRLLFPRRCSSVVRRCRKENPALRFRSVHELRQALRRARVLPAVSAAVLAVCVLAVLPAIPGYVQRQQERQQQRAAERRIRQIQEDFTVFYEAAADSLRDRSKVPHRHQAFFVRNTFVEKVYQYKQTVPEQEMLFVCDTVYARLLTSLSKLMMQIPE